MTTKLHFIYNKPHIGTRGATEYPLFDQFRLCPTARYVAGTSNYLCECRHPRQCLGVIKVAELYGEEYWKNYNKIVQGEKS